MQRYSIGMRGWKTAELVRVGGAYREDASYSNPGRKLQKSHPPFLIIELEITSAKLLIKATLNGCQ